MHLLKKWCLLWVTNQVIETVKESMNAEYISTNQLDIIDATNDKLHSPILPFAGREGIMIIKSASSNTSIKSMNDNISEFLATM